MAPTTLYKTHLAAIESEVASLILGHSWSQTSLGEIESWDAALKVTLDNLLRSPTAKFILWGPERLFFYNDAYAPILGARGNSVGKPFEKVWAEVADELRGLVDDVYSGKTFTFEDYRFLLLGANGPEPRYFTFTYFPLATLGGEIGGLQCDLTETTAAFSAKRALLESEKQHRETLENINEGYFAVDANWIITRANTNHEIFTQMKREDQLGKNLLELFFSAPEFKESQYWKSYHKAMEERVPVVFEEYYPPIDLWTRVSVYPQPDGGLAIFFARINEEKRIQKSLVQAKEEAERANELKSAFLANMSHEIRTPLGAMMGFANLLTDPGLSAVERANYIEILNRNGEQLGRVINDILDLSKVETGHINFEYMIVNPLHVAHEVVSLMSVLAKEKGIPLSFEDDGTTPESIVTDPTRMRQVLMNLVGNALKFTKVGFVKIRLSGYEGKAGEKCCAFEIEDSGTGIPESAVERLFKVFSQADNSMTRKFGGTGLGLALSRAIARKMGGDVRLVQSERDRGSTFHFSVESIESLRAEVEATIKRQQHEVPANVPANALKGVRVLLVEDSPDNQQLIWRYLSKYGAQIEIADNGLEGMRMAQTSEHDVVLMDIQMPVMDGYTAVAKLRERRYTKPIVALTAHAMADVKKKCQDVGYTTHLPKPIDPQVLVRTIASLVQSDKQTRES